MEYKNLCKTVLMLIVTFILSGLVEANNPRTILAHGEVTINTPCDRGIALEEARQSSKLAAFEKCQSRPELLEWQKAECTEFVGNNKTIFSIGEVIGLYRCPFSVNHNGQCNNEEVQLGCYTGTKWRNGGLAGPIPFNVCFCKEY